MNTPTIVPNYHVLIIKTLGATNFKPARISIKSERFEQSIIVPFTNTAGAVSPTIESATTYLASKGFDVIGKAEGKDCFYFISNTFEPLK